MCRGSRTRLELRLRIFRLSRDPDSRLHRSRVAWLAAVAFPDLAGLLGLVPVLAPQECGQLVAAAAADGSC